LLIFLDADTTVHGETVHGLERHLLDDAGLAAVFGSYDEQPRYTGPISQFRNLAHHFVHSKSSTRALTFWSGCGAIRRSALLRVGGFDDRFRKPSVEDIEFGYRLSAAGECILLDAALKVTHLKRWTLLDGLRTDVLDRGAPWFRLLLERRKIPNDLNVNVRYRLSTAAMAAGWISLLLALMNARILFVTALSFAFAVLLHADLMGFFARARGRRFLLVAIPLHLLQQTCNLAAVAMGSAEYLHARYAKQSSATGSLFEKSQYRRRILLSVASQDDDGRL
jgi:GT2 family glycosyltransferase